MLGLGSSNLSQGVVQSAIGKLISRLAGRSTYSENKNASKSTIKNISKGDILDKAAILLTPTSYSDGKMRSVKSSPSIAHSENFSTNTTNVNWAHSSAGTISYSGRSSVEKFLKLVYSGTSGVALKRESTLLAGRQYRITFKARGDRATAFTSIGANNILGAIKNPVLTTTFQDYEFDTTPILSSSPTVCRFYQGSGSATEYLDITDIIIQDTSSDFAFSRDSSATRVGPDGLLQDMQNVVGESELISNGDFTETGAELITNGNFASATGWTLGTGWSIGDDKAVFTGTSDTAIYQADVTTVNKNYKVSVEVLANEGTAANTIFLGTNEINSRNLSVGVHTFYAQALGNTILYIYGRANDELSITNITVKELGADWSSLDGAIDTYDENGVTIKSINADNDNRLSQNSVTEDGKSYKVTYKIHATSFSTGTVFQYFDGDNYRAFPEQGVGTHTFYFTRIGTDDFWNLNLNANSSGSLTDTVTISSISVQDITLADNLDIPRISYDKDGLNGHILLEPERTNLVTYSEDFTDYHTLAASLAYDASIIAPDGTAGVWQLLSNEASAAHYMRPINSQDNYEFLWGEHYTLSVYVKANVHDHIRLMIQTAGGGGANGTAAVYASSYYDITNSLVKSASQSIINSSLIEDMGNGWKKCSITGFFNFDNAGSFKMSGTINGQINAGASTTVVLDESMNFGTINDNSTLTAGCKMYSTTGANPTLIGTVTNISGTSVTLAAANAVECVDGATIYFSTLGGIRLQITGIGAGYGNKIPDAGGCYFWGVQFEKGNYVSSYIPTLAGSIVTRDAELLNGSGNSSLITNTEGVLYAEIANFGRRIDTNSYISLSNLAANSTNDSVVIGFNSNNADDPATSGKFYGRIEEGGVDKATWSALSASDGTVTAGHATNQYAGSWDAYYGFASSLYHKVALQYKTGDSKLYVNGSDVGAATTGNITSSFTFNPIVDSLAGSQRAVGVTNPFYGKIKCISYFDEELTDDELEALTGDSYNSFSELAAANGYTIQ